MSKSIFDLYSSNEKAETEGVWVEFEGFRVKVKFAGKSNKAFYSEFVAWQAKNKRAIANENLSKDGEKELARIYAKTIVTDWDGEAMNENGKPIICDFPTKVRVLSEMPHSHILMGEIMMFATNFKNFQEDCDSIAKN